MSKKSTLQKVSLVFGYASFISAFVCLVWLLVTKEGASEVYVASMSATAFFCFTAGVVLMTMGKANLPNLTPGSDDS